MKNAKELVKEVKADFESRKAARRQLEAKWMLNINFLMGNQHSELMSTGAIVDVGKHFYWQQQEVFNHIAPIIETRLAKFTRIKAGVTVRPVTSDLADVNTAKFATQLISCVKEENNLPELSRVANFWSEITGTAFYKVVWNSEAGQTVADTENGVIHEGDAEITVCPPYEVYPDSLACSDINECNSVIHAKAYPVKIIEDRWGVKLKGKNVTVVDTDGGVNGGGFGYSSYSQKIVSGIKGGHELVIERYTRPDKDNPEGKLTIVAGNELLYDGPLPYMNESGGARGLPFVRQTALSQPASFYGISVIERLIPVQRAYNAVKNRKHEYLNRLTLGVMTVEDGSLDLDNLEEEGLAPGKVLIYRQGATPPRMMSPGTVPPDFRDEEDRLLSEFISISGVSDFMSTSYLHRDNISGIALSLLIEQDDTRLSLTSESIRNAIRSVGKHIIRLYRQFATVKRLKRVAGENGEIERISFTGSDITSEDLVYDTENELTDTPASRKNAAVEIFKLGLLSDENGKLSETAKCKMLELLGFGNWEAARSSDELHIKQAAKENIGYISGETPKVSEVDKHSLHIGEHIAFLISGENKTDEACKKALTAHIREHRKFDRLQKEAEAINKTPEA